MKVEVTADDIKEGVRKDCHNCPVARAIERRFPDSEVVVEQDGAAITLPEGTVECWLFPGNVGDFIASFDEGFEVQPFTFEMEQVA